MEPLGPSGGRHGGTLASGKRANYLRAGLTNKSQNSRSGHILALFSQKLVLRVKLS